MQHVRKERLILDPRSASAAEAAGMELGQTFGVEVLREKTAILSMEAEWRALEKHCPNTVLFQSFDWCRNHLEFSANSATFEPLVFVIRFGGDVVGILPLCVQRNRGMKLLTGFSEPFQQYTEILLNPRYARNDVLAGLREELFAEMRRSGADYFHFGQVREEGMLARLFDGKVPTSGERDAAPYVELTDFETYEDYQQSINSKTRKNLRNAKNRLERDAPVTHAVARSNAMMKDVVARVYEGREAWLERLGITSRAFRNDDFEAFLQRFTTDRVKGVETIAMSLKHGDTPISDQWGFVYRGRYYAFMATWNPDYEAASPGRIHLGEVIRSCFEEGFETADFMIPASSYKLTWTKNAAPVCDYVLPLSFKGKAYNALWLNFARPLSKKIFFALPPKIRGLLVKKVLPVVE